MSSKPNLHRRQFLQVAGATATACVLTSCSSPESHFQCSDLGPDAAQTCWDPIDLVDHVDPQLRILYQVLPDPLFDLENTPVQVIRAITAIPSLRAPEGLTIQNIKIKTEDGFDLPLRIYRPDSLPSDAAAIYTIHAGGLVLGNVAQEDSRNIALATRLNVLVVAPTYRLAPENPYPVPLNDCYRGLTWLAESASELGVDKNRIAISGQSAGGCLAAAVTLRARDTDGPAICFQVLNYPMLDNRNETQSSFTMANSKMWGRKGNIWGWNAYLAGLSGTQDIPYYAVPARATDLRNLPPTYIAVGTLDLFLDESINYTRALMTAGVATELHVYPGAFHAVDLMPGVDIAKRWRDDDVAALRRGLKL